MNKLKINIKDDLFVSELYSHYIDTVFYIEYGNNFFPFYQWTDFTNSVLSMWTQDLLKYKNVSDIKFILYFMDGPYRLDVRKDGNMNLIIDCIHFKKTDISELTIECSYKEFLSAIYDAYKSFNYILYCHEMHKGRFEFIYKQTIIAMNDIRNALKDL